MKMSSAVEVIKGHFDIRVLLLALAELLFWVGFALGFLVGAFAIQAAMSEDCEGILLPPGVGIAACIILTIGSLLTTLVLLYAAIFTERRDQLTLLQLQSRYLDRIAGEFAANPDLLLKAGLPVGFTLPHREYEPAHVIYPLAILTFGLVGVVTGSYLMLLRGEGRIAALVTMFISSLILRAGSALYEQMTLLVTETIERDNASLMAIATVIGVRVHGSGHQNHEIRVQDIRHRISRGEVSFQDIAALICTPGPSAVPMRVVVPDEGGTPSMPPPPPPVEHASMSSYPREGGGVEGYER